MQLLSSDVGLCVSGRVHSYITVVPDATESSRLSSGPVPSGYRAPEETSTHLSACEVHALIHASLHSSLTLVALAVVQSMWVDAVRSGGYVPQLDEHCVPLLGHQYGSQVPQPVRLRHLRPVGGVGVLLVHSLLIDGADALGAFL